MLLALPAVWLSGSFIKAVGYAVGYGHPGCLFLIADW
jgi:hypothetical protein